MVSHADYLRRSMVLHPQLLCFRKLQLQKRNPVRVQIRPWDWQPWLWNPGFTLPHCMAASSGTWGCMVLYTINLSTLQAEAGGSSFQGQLWLFKQIKKKKTLLLWPPNTPPRTSPYCPILWKYHTIYLLVFFFSLFEMHLFEALTLARKLSSSKCW